MKIRNAVTKIDDQNIKKLYLSAFPKEERPPFFLLKRKAAHGKGTFLVIEDENRFLGFVHLVIAEKLIYLAFFAMNEESRNQGYGSKVLQELKERYAGRSILIAREQLDPLAGNYAMRVRRYGFYSRNGFHDLPCQIIEANVHYDAMSTGPVQPEDYNQIVKDWAGPVISKIIGFKMIQTK